MPKPGRSLIIALLSTTFGLQAATGLVQGQQTEGPTRSTALALLQQILARPEFQWEEPQQSFLERVWEWLLRQFFNLLPEAAGSGRLATVILATAGLAVLLLVIAYIVLRLRRQFGREEKQGAEADFTNVQDAKEALASAESIAEKGDYRLALRYLYLSSLLLLHERGLINYDRTQTNREYLESIRHQPHLVEILRDIVSVFERSWYGIQTPDEPTYNHFMTQVRRLQELR